MDTIISIEQVYQMLEQQTNYISVVELAMILEANTSEVRQRLYELGDRVDCNQRDEWIVTGGLVDQLEFSPLSASEIEERNRLENTVQQAFYQAGQALKQLRDRKLYRETHATFEAYVRDRFDYSKRAAYYLISASEVIENLKSEPLVHLLPSKERQCREIARLPIEQQPNAWLTSLERAKGKIPPARIVKEVVNEIKKEPKMKPKQKFLAQEIVRTTGMETEYLIYSDRETYQLLEAYRQKIGAATKNGAIRRLLHEQNQRANL